MDWVEGVVASSDSGWKVLGIFLIGIYVLLWKFGSELLKLARENNTVAKQAHTIAKTASQTAMEVRNEARQISRNIITNHGSKNLGDAIDRLTEWMMTHMKEQRESDAALSNLKAEVVLLMASNDINSDRLHTTLSDLDDRLTKIETDRELH